jgi:hypothetical protein
VSSFSGPATTKIASPTSSGSRVGKSLRPSPSGKDVKEIYLCNEGGKIDLLTGEEVPPSSESAAA